MVFPISALPTPPAPVTVTVTQSSLSAKVQPVIFDPPMLRITTPLTVEPLFLAAYLPYNETFPPSPVAPLITSVLELKSFLLTCHLC